MVGTLAFRRKFVLKSTLRWRHCSLNGPWPDIVQLRSCMAHVLVLPRSRLILNWEARKSTFGFWGSTAPGAGNSLCFEGFKSLAMLTMPVHAGRRFTIKEE